MQVHWINEILSRPLSNLVYLMFQQFLELLFNDLHRTTTLFYPRRLQKAFVDVVHPQDRNCRNEILQTIIFALLELHFYPFDSKTVKYAENDLHLR